MPEPTSSVSMSRCSFDFCSSDDESSHYWHLAETPRPRGATTQWLALRARFHDFVRHSPASHFAVALRARLGFDATGVPRSISGRGLTLGDTSLAHNITGDAAFGGARAAQVESFWPGGNFLYRETAVDMPLEDGRWYAVELHVNDERWVAFTLDGVTRCVQDRATHPVIAEANGALIALGRGPKESGPWRVEFRDIATGWF
jgi:hypothetical protein